MPLSEAAIHQARPGFARDGRATSKAYKMGDAGGLFLLVTPTGGKWWRLKYRFGGKEKSLSLGVYPEVSLEDARRGRDAARRLLFGGVDPSEVRRKEKAQAREVARKSDAARFALDNKGALKFHLGSRRLTLTPLETAELHAFLDATRAPAPK